MGLSLKFKRDAVPALLKGKAMQDDIRRRAERIASAAGPGMDVQLGVGPNRARGVVITATHKARAAEASRRALTRAIDAGRG